jgi:hypothetical protein
MTRRLARLTLIVMVVGCATSFPSIKPIAPSTGHPLFPTTVDSLRPTFQWEASPDPGATYDLVIHEGIGSIYENKRAVGKEVYYRQGLSAARWTVEEPLKPDTEYYWSVRVRRGTVVSEWARYDFYAFTGLGFGSIQNHLFVFKTPKGEK